MKMLPNLAPYDHVNESNRYPVFPCQRRARPLAYSPDTRIVTLWNVLRPYRDNIRFGKFGILMLASHGHSILVHHVAGVISRSPKKKMVGPDAGSIITFMKNPEPCGNRAKMQLPRKPIGRHSLRFREPKRSIALSQSPSPLPAILGFSDIRPKSFGCITFSRHFLSLYHSNRGVKC